MTAAPEEETKRIGIEHPVESSAFVEAIRSKFAPAPTGRTFVPKYDEEEPGPHGEKPAVIPEGMSAAEERNRRKAFYEQAATPADTERQDPKAAAAYESLYGKEHVGTGGFRRLSETRAKPERVSVGTERLDNPELRTQFAEYMAKKYPKGASRMQQLRGAAEFLRGDPETGMVAPVDPKLLREFLERDDKGKKKRQAKPFSDRELRRVGEVML